LQLFLQYDKDGSRAIGPEELKQMLIGGPGVCSLPFTITSMHCSWHLSALTPRTPDHPSKALVYHVTSDLDGLQDIPQTDVDEYCKQQFHMADQNHDGILSIDEFYLYFYSSLCFKFPVLASGVNPGGRCSRGTSLIEWWFCWTTQLVEVITGSFRESHTRIAVTNCHAGADLFNIFTKYCSAGKQFQCQDMGSSQFMKLCKDARLMNARVRKADIDLIYSRARAETEVLEAHVRKPGADWSTAKM
jgi:hypothetical protein